MTDFQPVSLSSLRMLGKTGLQVSALCVGCAPLGNMPDTFTYSVAEDQALETVRAIFKSPITFADTAASYGNGESERRIGLALKELGGVPAGYVLATKADRDLQTGDFSGAQIRRSIERSLRLLNLDVLPLVYLHDPEHITFEEAMAPGGPVEALQRCKEEGLVEHIGVAGGPIDMMTRFVETDIFEVAISHNRYTLLNTEADPFWDVCQRHKVGAVNAAPYNSGILSKGPGMYPRYQYEQADENVIAQALKFEEASSRYGIPLAAVALQFSLRDPRIASTVIGLSRPERLEETVKLSQIAISDELWSDIEAIRLG